MPDINSQFTVNYSLKYTVTSFITRYNTQYKSHMQVGINEFSSKADRNNA